MKKIKLKRTAIYSLYGMGFLTLIGVLYLIDNGVNKGFNGVDNNYVNKTVIDSEIPVVNTAEIIIRPYSEKNIKIIKSYYDYKAESTSQEKSLLYYENTYLQNSGVSYGQEEVFDVLSIYDGTVTSIKEDKTLGKIVEITHSNDMVSIYQSLSEILVTENQEIKQGTVIGKSGTCNIENDLNNHLHFELIIKGLIVNPENYYDKKVSEL